MSEREASCSCGQLRATVTGGSTEYVRRSDEEGEVRRFYFCPECGSTVFYTTGDSNGLVAIAVGAFAEPGFPAPTISVWEERAHSWVVPPPGAEHIR